jgi:hypothetical protein
MVETSHRLGVFNWNLLQDLVVYGTDAGVSRSVASGDAA